jgi:hypothetical protein
MYAFSARTTVLKVLKYIQNTTHLGLLYIQIKNFYKNRECGEENGEGDSIWIGVHTKVLSQCLQSFPITFCSLCVEDEGGARCSPPAGQPCLLLALVSGTQ